MSPRHADYDTSSPIAGSRINRGNSANFLRYSTDQREGASEPLIPAAIRVIAMPADTNRLGNIFRGWLMCQMDLNASSVAARRSGGRAATAAVESMAFLLPVKVGDEASVYANLVSSGTTSMKIAVEAWRHASGLENAERVIRSVFTFVAVDEDRRPRALPPQQK